MKLRSYKDEKFFSQGKLINVQWFSWEISLWICVLQNALAATAAPFQGQFSGYEAFPQYAAATGETLSNKIEFLMI